MLEGLRLLVKLLSEDVILNILLAVLQLDFLVLLLQLINLLIELLHGLLMLCVHDRIILLQSELLYLLL